MTAPLLVYIVQEYRLDLKKFSHHTIELFVFLTIVFSHLCHRYLENSRIVVISEWSTNA